MQIDQMPSAFNSGLSGVKKAEQGVEDAAVQVSRLNIEQNQVQSETEDNKEQLAMADSRPQPELTEEVVNLAVNEHLAAANSKSIKTADDMIGTLIDTKV
jgi:flagellar hook-associated protein FlgK